MAKYLFPTQPFFLVFALGLAALLGLSTGCTPAIGDECTSAQDCPMESGAVCDTTVPNGYCLIQGCQIGDCPSNSTCVQFDRNASFCMALCESDADCRSGLVCRMDHNLEGSSVGYCYVPSAEAPREYDRPDAHADDAGDTGGSDTVEDASDATGDAADSGPDDANTSDADSGEADTSDVDSGEADIADADAPNADSGDADTADNDTDAN